MIVRMDKENGSAKAEESRGGKSIIVVKDAREVGNLLGGYSGLGNNSVVRLCLVKTAARPEGQILAGLQRAARQASLRRGAISPPPPDSDEDCSDELTVDEDDSSDEEVPAHSLQKSVDAATETEVVVEDFLTEDCYTQYDQGANEPDEVTPQENCNLFEEVVYEDENSVGELLAQEQTSEKAEEHSSIEMGQSREESPSLVVIDHQYVTDEVEDEEIQVEETAESEIFIGSSDSVDEVQIVAEPVAEGQSENSHDMRITWDSIEDAESKPGSWNEDESRMEENNSIADEDDSRVDSFTEKEDVQIVEEGTEVTWNSNSRLRGISVEQEERDAILNEDEETMLDNDEESITDGERIEVEGGIESKSGSWIEDDSKSIHESWNEDSKSQSDCWNDENASRGDSWNGDVETINVEEDEEERESVSQEEDSNDFISSGDDIFLDDVELANKYRVEPESVDGESNRRNEGEFDDQTVPELDLGKISDSEASKPDDKENEFIVVDDSDDELTLQEPEISCTEGSEEVEVGDLAEEASLEKEEILTIRRVHPGGAGYSARFGSDRPPPSSPPAFEKLARCNVEIRKISETESLSPPPSAPEDLIIEQVTATTGPSYSERASAPPLPSSCSCPSCLACATPQQQALYDPLLIDWRANDALRYAMPSKIVDKYSNFVHFLLSEMDALEICESSKKKIKNSKRLDVSQNSYPSSVSINSGSYPYPSSSLVYNTYQATSYSTYAAPSSYNPFFPTTPQAATAPISYPSYPNGYLGSYPSGGYPSSSYPISPSVAAGFPTTNCPSNYPNCYQCCPPAKVPTPQLTITPVSDKAGPLSPTTSTSNHITITPLPPKVNPMSQPMLSTGSSVMGPSAPMMPSAQSAMLTPSVQSGMLPQSAMLPQSMLSAGQNMMPLSPAMIQPPPMMPISQAKMPSTQAIMSSAMLQSSQSMMQSNQALLMSAAQSMMPPPPPPLFQPKLPRKRGRPPLDPNYDKMNQRARTWWSGGTVFLPGQQPRFPGVPMYPSSQMYTPPAAPLYQKNIPPRPYQRRHRLEESPVATVPSCNPSKPVGGRSMTDLGPEKTLAELSRMVTPRCNEQRVPLNKTHIDDENHNSKPCKRPLEKALETPVREPSVKKVATAEPIGVKKVTQLAGSNAELSIKVKEKESDTKPEKLSTIVPVENQSEVKVSEIKIPSEISKETVKPAVASPVSKDTEEVQKLLAEARARKAARAKTEVRILPGSHLPVMAMPRPLRSAQPLRPPPRKPSPPSAPSVSVTSLSAPPTKRIKVMLPRRDGVVTVNVEPVAPPPKPPTPPPPQPSKSQSSPKVTVQAKTPLPIKGSSKSLPTRQQPKFLPPSSPPAEDAEVTRSGRKRKVIHGNPKFRDMEMLDPRELRLSKTKAPSAKEAAQARQMREMARVRAAKQKEKVQEAKYKQFLAVNDIYLKPQTFV